MKAQTIALAGIALVAIVGLAVLGTWRWASAIGPDVNNDGGVVANDISAVVAAFGTLVPVEPLKVIEQNLDVDGNIKVHEQGTVDVNVLGSGAPPVLHTLFDSEPFGASELKNSPLFDVSGCTRFQVFVNHGVASSGNFVLWSVDGSFAFVGETFSASSGSIDSNETNVFEFEGFAPYAGIRLKNNDSGGSITAHLYCIP